MKRDKIEIGLIFRSEKVLFSLSPYSSCASIFYEEDADSYGEVPYQIVEGCDYEYQLPDGFQLEECKGIVCPSKYHLNSGHLKTGNYVGQLSLGVTEISSGIEIGHIRFEVRSVKASYRRDYRIMLEDITAYYTELVMQAGSPVSQNFEVSENTDPITAYQRFAFVQSIIDSESFADALHKIQNSPLKKWKESKRRCSINDVRRIDRKIIRQLVGASDRVSLSSECPLSQYMSSAPRHVSVASREETLDIPENQFVKYVLLMFHSFCMSINRRANTTPRLKNESRHVCDKLEEYLNLPFLRNLSALTFLPLNSPALQKKEGYREILQAWLMFDLAAVLTWSGGEDVYKAGTKNVAALYEYWLFFVLLETISSIFNIPACEKVKLVCLDDDKLNLSLKQGKFCMVKGKCIIQNRTLNIRFSYNRTFMSGRPLNYQGSWTKSMRPDYTLSVWPGDINMAEAERDNLIAHIHFDAKYKLDKILLGDPKSIDRQECLNALDEEKNEAQIGVYKRIDLLKMHAYKDAIRRTVGAYVLYPGDAEELLMGYHEIIPGLGAFAISPSDRNTGITHLAKFINDVVIHFLNRSSQREKMSYYQYETYRNNPGPAFMKSIPENVRDNRGFMPDETMVLVADIKNISVFKWMCERHLFAFCLGYDADIISLDHYMNARYLLLHDNDNIYGLVRIQTGYDDKRNAPYICSRTELLKKGWPHNTNDKGLEKVYLVFNIDPNMSCEKELESYRWNLNDILPNLYKKEQVFSLSLIDLINKAI